MRARAFTSNSTAATLQRLENGMGRSIIAPPQPTLAREPAGPSTGAVLIWEEVP